MNISHIALGGIQAAEKQLDSIASKIAKLPLVAAAAGEDTTDLGAAMIGLIQAQRMAQANLMVLKTADEMNGKILNVLG